MPANCINKVDWNRNLKPYVSKLNKKLVLQIDYLLIATQIASTFTIQIKRGASNDTGKHLGSAMSIFDDHIILK